MQIRNSLVFFVFTILVFSEVSLAGPVDQLQAGNWYEAPNTRMQTVFPSSTPDGFTGSSSVMSTWNGGAYDSTRDRLIVWGGGHRDYAGNEVYVFDVNTLKWARVNEPSNPTSECVPYYSDGNPSSPHTYNSLQYLAVTDRFVAAGAAVPYGDVCSQNSNTNLFNFSTNSWERGTPHPPIGNAIALITAYDSGMNELWVHGTGSAGRLARYNSVTDVWTNYGNFINLEIYGTAAIDPERRIMVSVGGYSGRQIYVWDLDNPSAPPIVPNTTGDQRLESSAAPGFAFDPVSKKFVGWYGGTQVYTLDPATWNWSRVDAASSNSVSPTAPEANGTNGRFRYIPSKNAFVVVNRTNENVFFYKLTSGGGATNPSISFSAASPTISPGAGTLLTWSSNNTTSCTASGAWSGSQALSGNVSVSPASTSTYTLNCTGAQGSTTRSVTVTIASPTVSLGSSPASIIVGDNSTLTWSSSNATSCTASGAWSGSKALLGSESVSPGNTGAYTLSCSGAGGTTISSTTVTVRAVGSAAASLQTTFGNDSVGSDPANWFDSAANNSMAADDSLFSIMSIGGQNVFGTTQISDSNIHSHYVGLGSDGWSNYQYSGRLRISALTDTIGLTFLSDYPSSDRYYRLRREGSTSFYIAPHGTGIECTGTTDTGVTPAANTWYRFSIQAEDLGDRTAVRAKVWAEGSAEPANWQASCEDTGTRLTTGTVGVWSVIGSYDFGAKYWDDLRVEPLSTTTPPPPIPSDADADGLLDTWELTYYADLTIVSGSTDTDGDGLTAAQEVTYGTDPTLTDSDGDGDSDGQEVAYGADPNLPTDSLDDHRPAVPAILTPPASVPLIGYVFTASSFSDPDTGEGLGASQWQIATDSQFSTLMLDRTLSGRAELEVALGVLDLAASYQIRVRHQDSAGLWSAWSSARAITMASSDVNDSDSNGIDDRYQVSSADTNANGINDPDEGLCNLGDITGNQILGFETNTGTVRCTSVMNETDLPSGSTSEDFPFGIFSFGVDGLAVNPQNPATVEISIYFPNALATDTRWYKYDPSSQQVSDFSSNVTISGNVAVLRLTDGGAGDADGVVNGRITDPSGPVFASTSPPAPPAPPTTPPSTGGSAASSGGGGGAFNLLWLLMLAPLVKTNRRDRVCRAA